MPGLRGEMVEERVLGFIALLWLLGSLLLMARSIQRGRRLADRLSMHHPELYESLGRPRPGFLESRRRSRFARFVGRGEFRQLVDPVLAEDFESYRKSEARLVVSVVSIGAILALATVLARFTR